MASDERDHELITHRMYARPSVCNDLKGLLGLYFGSSNSETAQDRQLNVSHVERWSGEQLARDWDSGYVAILPPSHVQPTGYCKNVTASPKLVEG